MAFVGEIVAATRNRDGSVTLRMRRDGAGAGESGEYAEVVRTVVPPVPAKFEAGVVGTEVEGDGRGAFLVGGVPFLTPVSYTRVRLAPKARRKK